MTPLHHDPQWPRASAWLAGEFLPGAKGLLNVAGVPMSRGSITPGQCNLAPAAIRAALQRFSTADLTAGHDLRALRIRDLGDLAVAHLDPTQAFATIRDALAKANTESTAVVALGGDNSITVPAVHALGVPLDRCGLITFDAHLDLRHLDNGLTNGNPVRALLRDGLPADQVVQIGLQSFANSPAYAKFARDAGIQTVTVDDVHEYGMDKVVHSALGDLGSRVDRIHVDFDLDVLDRAYAPATPGSRPGGITPFELRRAAQLCGAHHRVRSIDLVEIDPTQDHADITSLAAAACLLSFASGVLSRFATGMVHQ